MEMCEREDHTQLSPESYVHNPVENNEERAVGHYADSRAFVDEWARLDDVDVDEDVASKIERLVTKKYACFLNSVAGMGLERAWEMTPLIRVSCLSVIFLEALCRVCFEGQQCVTFINNVFI